MSTTQLPDETTAPAPDEHAAPGGPVPTTASPRLGDVGSPPVADVSDEQPIPESADRPEEDQRLPIDAWRTGIAASLGGAAAGWMLGGAFSGYFAEVAGVVAAAAGGLFAGWSYRLRNPSAPQLALLPGAVVLAALFAALTTGADIAQIPDLVTESLRQGGLALPPVPFDPGWRVLVVLISAFVTITGATLAVSLDRARVAVAVPGVVAMVAILLQPAGSELMAVTVALVLGLGGLAVAYGTELARDGAAESGGFELRRLARAGGVSVLLVVALTLLGQVGFLFPETDTNQVVPPRRPEAPPPPRDRVIFTAESDDTQPWRVGTLDVYSDGAWMTPPFDPAALVDLASFDGDVAAALPEPSFPGSVLDPAETIEVSFTLQDVEGRVVPLLAATTAIDGNFGRLEFYPRTQTLQVDGRQASGTTYTVTAAAPPAGSTLSEAPDPDTDDPVLASFLDAPEPGPVAATLLAEAVALDAPLYEKLQFVRSRFYDKVIAAGTGEPLDVDAARLEQMLQEAEANPYEIVAGEALLARMVGVPARLGFGYFGGDVPAGGDGSVRELRPKHGAMWLEAYFEGHGWVPIMGKPPRAKSSLSDDQQEPDPFVQATDEIAARVFVPTAGRSLAPLYILVRFWLARVLPFVLVAVVLIGGYPAVFKRIRRWRRRRWAMRTGPRARIAVAYADIRDIANDLNIGHPSLTPIEFLDVTQPDAEHRELAWLVTRVMWGDLRRDVRDSDADAAEDVAGALRKRLLGGQAYIMRTLAAISRASLTEPWDARLPNVWWGWRRRQRRRIAIETGLVAPETLRARRWRRLPAFLRPRRRRTIGWRRFLRVPPLRVTVPAVTVVVMLAMIALTGGIRAVDLTTPASFSLPDVPEHLPGYTFERFEAADEVFAFYDAEGQSLVAGGEFHAVREGEDETGLVVGTLEVAAFKPGVRERPEQLVQGLLRALLIDPQDLIRLGGERVYVKRVPEQTLYLWLAPDLSAFQLFTAGREFRQPDAVLAGLLAAQRGEAVDQLKPPTDTPPLDARRGTP